MQQDQSKASIQRTLGEVKAFLAQEAPPKLSEADTKQHFIEPIVAALGWQGIGVVTREYYVKNSQEFIDYVMRGPAGPLLAVEAKQLLADLSDKHAAQLIQYCSVEGIEWAALTNGRELQFFNAYLKGDLAAKRILRLDLLAFNNEAEFDALFDLLWQLSRMSMTTPEGVHAWLNRRRLDAAVRATILDPASPAVRAIRKALSEAEVKATPQDITQWFASRLNSELAQLPAPTPPTVATSRAAPTGIGQPLMRDAAPAGDGRVISGSERRRTKQYFGVKLADLVAAGMLLPGTALVLMNGPRDIAGGTLTAAGEIEHDGFRYRSPSDTAFAALMKRQSLNGWTHWHAELPGGRVSLAQLRSRLSMPVSEDPPTDTASP